MCVCVCTHVCVCVCVCVCVLCVYFGLLFYYPNESHLDSFDVWYLGGQPAIVCLAIQIAILHDKILTLDAEPKLSNQSFVPAVFIGTIDLYNFRPL